MIFLLNGPPRSGKDTIANFLVVENGLSHHKLSDELKRRTHALYGINDVCGDPLPHGWFEREKDQPRVEFRMKTPREAYIAVHDGVLKPLHGPSILADLLLERHREGLNGSVISDLGSDGEIARFVKEYGRKLVVLIRVHRPDCTWDNRYSVGGMWEEILDCHHIYNDSTPEYLCGGVRKIMENYK